MELSKYHKIINILIASVWLINGLFCKILDLTPRHQQIVSEILGASHSRIFTILIGLSEVIMVIWILSKFKYKINAALQIIIIITMNIIEFIVVPNLLLWGKLNIVFAILFCLLIYYNNYINKEKDVGVS